MGLQTFADDPKNHFLLMKYSRKIDYLNAMNFPYTLDGRTMTNEALESLHMRMFKHINGDRDAYDNVVLLFTDGRSADRERTWQEAVKARKAGIHLIVVLLGVSRGFPEIEAQLIASLPLNTNIIRVTNFRFDAHTDEIINLICDCKYTFYNTRYID